MCALSIGLLEHGRIELHVGAVSGPPGRPVRRLVELAGAVHGDKVYAVPECRVLDLLYDGGEHNGSASHVVDVDLGRVVVRLNQHNLLPHLCS